MSSDQIHWEREQEFLTEERKRVPELFTMNPPSSNDVYRRIGIHPPSQELPLAYLKFSPLDFIVEELSTQGECVTIDRVSLHPSPPEGCEGEGTVWADLVKVNVSTIDAIKRLSEALHIDQKRIAYAGIKDAAACTAQTISIRQSTREEVSSLSLQNIALHNIVEGKGAISVGSLSGNRFTLLLRTEKLANMQQFSACVDRIQTHGVMNYYGAQRFGTPRLLSHVYGMHMLREEYEEAVKKSICEQSMFELPYYAQMREKLEDMWGEWAAMKNILKHMPHSFRHELKMIDALAHGGDAIAALCAVADQAQLWVMAYASFLTNSALARMETSGMTKKDIPSSIPLFLSRSPEALQFYKPWTEKHGTEKCISALRPFSFIHIGEHPTITPMVCPTVHEYRIVKEGVVISFDLEKGAYATTVLQYLFVLTTELPIPAWMDTNEIDTKKILATGSTHTVAQQFRNEIDRTILAKKQRPTFIHERGSE